MSTLEVDNLKGVTSANDVKVTVGASVTQKLHDGIAKAYIATEGEATPTIRISLNHSTVTDNGVGDQTMTYTNNFSAIGCLTAGTYHNAVVVMHQILSRSTSTHGVKTHDHASAPEDDLGKKHAVFGDLA
jgi:hypothetical protein|tara:strand:+ start:238 stop:627 length:390 start_codon:yes stop_codon:yes gene_type:complete